MAYVDVRVGGTTPLAQVDSGRNYTQYYEHDCSETNVTAADVLQIFNVPIGHRIHEVVIQVVTAEGGTLTLDVGTYDATPAAIDANGFFVGAEGNSAARLSSADAVITQGAPSTVVPAYGINGHFCTVATTIGVLFNNTADAAKIRFWCRSSEYVVQ